MLMVVVMALSTGQSRAAESRQQDIIITRISLRAQRAIAREIARAMTEAAELAAKGEPMPADQIMAKHKDQMTRLLTELWTAAGAAMGERVAESLRDKDKKAFDVLEAEFFARALSDWIRTYSSGKITEITETTRGQIIDLISDSVAQGMTNAEIGVRIRAIAPTKSASRAQTIARTETHGTSQALSVEMAKRTGTRMRKVWLSVDDDRTRRRSEGAYFDHAAADGQTVDMDQPFLIQGPNGPEALMHPGDPDGSAGNVISCRCIVAYDVADD